MEQVVPLKINVEKSKDKELAKKYRVTALPTLLCIDPDGNVLESELGFKSPEQMVGWVRKVSGKYAAKHKQPDAGPNLEEQLKKNPDSGELNARYAVQKLESGKIDEAKVAIAKAEAAKYAGAPLVEAYIALGARYQTSRDFDQALVVYKKADKIAKDPELRSGAKLGLMDSHDGLHDEAQAKKLAREIIALKGANPEHVEAAKKYLGE